MSLIFLASLLKLILLWGAVPCGLPELGARGGWQGATSYPAATEHTGDLGEGGGDANWAFQAPATPTNCTLESCHEGLGFVLDLSLEVGMDKMPGERFSYLIEYI